MSARRGDRHRRVGGPLRTGLDPSGRLRRGRCRVSLLRSRGGHRGRMREELMDTTTAQDSTSSASQTKLQFVLTLSRQRRSRAWLARPHRKGRLFDLLTAQAIMRIQPCSADPSRRCWGLSRDWKPPRWSRRRVLRVRRRRPPIRGFRPHIAHWRGASATGVAAAFTGRLPPAPPVVPPGG